MSTEIGKIAEAAVADYLETQGYRIIERNWKTKYCEIDLIGKKQSIIYFIEVKYRANAFQGTGFDYITPTKMRQIAYGAQYWNAINSWDGDYRIIAAAVSGPKYDDIKLIEV